MDGRPSDGDHAQTGTTVDELADRLQQLIVTGELPSGSWLRQERLAADFGVSRTPIREALRALQARGLIELHPHRGALVCGPTARDIREAYAVRAQLEGYAAELAAEWARDPELDRLTQAAGLFERLVESEVARPTTPPGHDRPRWQEANDRFHEAILEAAGNLRLKAMIDDLHTSFPRNLTWSALAGHSALLKENVDQHREILRAIQSRDPVGARAAMVAHVRRAGDLVARRFDELAAQTTGPTRI